MIVKIPYKLFPIANKYEFWAQRSKRVKKEYTLVASYIEELPQLPVKVTLTRIAPRAWDSDNAIIAFKNIRDAISCMYFPLEPKGKMDETEYFQWNYEQKKGDSKEHAIEIRIETNSEITK